MLGMVSEPVPSMDCGVNVGSEQPVTGSLPNKKNHGKLPRKVHKAEREKLKRDQLNELFLELGHALEPARQNNGKASILGDATRILRDLLLKVESLRKENTALVTESHYVTVEKNELKDETTALEAEVARLHNELRERLQSAPMQHNSSTGLDLALPAQSTNTALPVGQPPVAPFFILPFRQDLQALPEAAATPCPPKPVTEVKRPHARYPNPSDSWPLQVLLRNQNNSNNSSSNSSENDSMERA